MKLTSPAKVLWPASGTTKADLADYYDTVADRLLPELADRPVTLRHNPRGVDEPGYLRKNLPEHAPPSIRRWSTYAHSARRDVAYALIDDREGLRWCAQQNVTELHPMLMRVDRPDRVDRVVFDLDPSPTSISAPAAALIVREVLDWLGLSALVKTSGGKGLHLIVPIERRYPTSVLQGFTEAVGRCCVENHPDQLTLEMKIDRREGRLLVDCSRVGIGATLIAAWSPRARASNTVATPLEWSEVEVGMDLDRFTMDTAMSRPDPWHDVRPQRLEGAFELLGPAPSTGQ